jgi:hypothetical protein
MFSCFWSCHLQWENIDKIKEFNWNFENLEVCSTYNLQSFPSLVSTRRFFFLYLVSLHCITWFIVGEQKALEEGGKLYGKTVYVFGSTERKYSYSYATFEVALSIL